LATFANHARIDVRLNIAKRGERENAGMPTKNVNLTDHYSDLIDRLVASGRYKNASEVVRAGLRLLEQSTAEDKQRLAILRDLAAEGFDQLDQGGGIELTGRRNLSAHIAKLGRQSVSNDRRRKSI
jgi:antitoxin ParD1/3/4